MIKSFLILLISSISLFCSQQIILVVADNFTTSHAVLTFYDDERVLLQNDVNIGRNGLGWGIGEYQLIQKMKEPLKKEGDGKAPAGVFKLTNIFGYDKNAHVQLPYLFASKDLICVDDSNSNFYNQIIHAHGDEKSFEYMRRKDNQYKLGVTVLHNKYAKIMRGSCIFLHIQKGKDKGTAGCTSMQEKYLVKIIHLLDKRKNPLLIQIPKSSLEEIKKIFPQL